MLEYRIETRRVVDHCDLQSLIQEYYGCDGYDLVADMECNNGQTLRITAKPDAPYTHRIDTFKATGRYQYLLCYLVDDLCAKGLIEPGEYSIEIYW